MTAEGWRMETVDGVVELVDEGSEASPERDWLHVEELAGGCRVTSRLGLVVDGIAVALFAAAGGATGAHRHSAVWRDGRLYLAVGPHLCCLRPKPFELLWSTTIDPATCFGVHYDAPHDAFISHGELEIARFSDTGAVLWRRSGADIFSGELILRPACVEVTDFDCRRYGFDYADGHTVDT